MVYNSTHGVLSMLRVHGKHPIVPGIQAGKNSEGGSCIRGNTRMQRNLPASMWSLLEAEYQPCSCWVRFPKSQRQPGWLGDHRIFESMNLPPSREERLWPWSKSGCGPVYRPNL